MLENEANQFLSTSLDPLFTGALPGCDRGARTYVASRG